MSPKMAKREWVGYARLVYMYVCLCAPIQTTEEATQLKSDVKAQQERIDNVRTELVDLARAEDKLKVFMCIYIQYSI